MPVFSQGAWVVTTHGTGRVVDRFWRYGTWWYTVRSEHRPACSEQVYFAVQESDILREE